MIGSSRSRSSTRIGLLSIFILLLVATGSVAALAGGAGGSSGSPTTAPAANQSGDQTNEVVTEVDSNLRVTNYSYNEDEEIMTVVLENQGGGSSAVTITELISSSSGGGSFGVEQLTVSSGETVAVDVNVRMRSGEAGVMITTQQSLANGEGAFVKVDESISLITGAATWTDVRVGSIVGVGATILVTLLISWRRVRQRDQTYQQVGIQ